MRLPANPYSQPYAIRLYLGEGTQPPGNRPPG